MSVLCLIGTFLLLAGSALAMPIIYTLSATGSGSLGSNSFSNSFFQITTTADTDQIFTPLGGVFVVPDLTAIVFVSGLGTATFSIATDNVTNQNPTGSPVAAAGFSAPVQNLGILGVGNPAFATYDLSTAIGPLSGPGLVSIAALFATSMGDFSLVAVSTATFEATLVPEPATLDFLTVGVAVLAGCPRRWFALWS